MLLKSSSARATRAKVLALLMGVLCLGAILPASASAMSAAAVTGWHQTWGTNGRVSAILADPATGRVYVAGSFTAVTDPSGGASLPIAHLAAFIPATGRFDKSWRPDPKGTVNALALSGGRLYLGGDFTQVARQHRSHLASVDPAGAGALTSWAPAVAGGTVDALAVSGGRVYVGGNFTSLGGVGQGHVGRVGVSTGALDTGWAPRVNGQVRSLVASGDGSRVYLGGNFTTVNGNGTGRSIASLSAAAPATLTPGFNAGPTNAGKEPPVYSLYLDGSDLLAAVGGAGGGCAALNAGSGATRWSKHTNGNVHAVTAMSGTVYCGGHFDGPGSFGGQIRNKLAAVDESTGQLLGFSLRVNSSLGIWALGHDSTRVYLGGDFSLLNGRPQPHFAVLS
jgi:hypothetical protein